MKIEIDLPEKTVAHIRSDYGHDCKGLRDDDRHLIVDEIYKATTKKKSTNTYTPRKDTDGDDPMVGIVWYNGLDEIVIKWKDYKKGDDAPYYAYQPGLDDGNYRQLEMVWMYLVLCFGNYGTSPRSGWIEDFEGYKKWFEGLEELMKPIA